MKSFGRTAQSLKNSLTRKLHQLSYSKIIPYAFRALVVLLLSFIPIDAAFQTAQNSLLEYNQYIVQHIESTQDTQALSQRSLAGSIFQHTDLDSFENEEPVSPVSSAMVVSLSEIYEALLEFAQISDFSEIDALEMSSTSIKPMVLSAIHTVEVGTEPILDGVTLAAESGSDTASVGTFIWPVEGSLTSRFGPRNTSIGSSNHRGIDIAARHGNPIFAVDGGEVIESRWSDSYGLMVKIRHDNGIITLYSHNSENLVRVGERVSQGHVIARIGRTGVASADHLHFEVIVDGVRVDPLLHLP